MHPLISEVNLHTVDVIDFLVLIDFLYFSQDSIHIDFRYQIYPILGYEIRRISSTKLAHLLPFVSQMAEE